MSEEKVNNPVVQIAVTRKESVSVLESDFRQSDHALMIPLVSWDPFARKTCGTYRLSHSHHLSMGRTKHTAGHPDRSRCENGW